MLTVITPTGDRPVQFNLLVEMMKAQTKQPDVWFIIDDGKEKLSGTNNDNLVVALETMLFKTTVHYIARESAEGVTLKANLLSTKDFISENPDNKIIIMEDDDYYPSTYLAKMEELLAEGVDIVGGLVRKYYNLTFQGYWEFKNGNFPTFNSLGFKVSALPLMYAVCEGLSGYEVDLEFCKLARANKLNIQLHSELEAQLIGVKGWKVGRQGAVAVSHRTGKGKYKPDEDLTKLTEYFDKFSHSHVYLEQFGIPKDIAVPVKEEFITEWKIGTKYRFFIQVLDEAVKLKLATPFNHVELFWNFCKMFDMKISSYLEISSLDAISMYVLPRALPKGSTIDFLHCGGGRTGLDSVNKVIKLLTEQSYVTTLHTSCSEVKSSYDYIFVDESHSYKDIKEHTEFAISKINSTGKIFIHDTVIEKLASIVKLYVNNDIKEKFNGEELDSNRSGSYGILWFEKVNGKVAKLDKFAEYENMVDLVIPLGNGSKWDNNEIRYCVRSFEQNFDNLGCVYVITDALPAWMRNVVHINCGELNGCKDSKIIYKVMTACGNKRLTNNFIFSCDDHIVLNKITNEDLCPRHCFDIAVQPESYFNDLWKSSLKEAMKNLLRMSLGAICFESHTPVIFNKHLFQSINGMFPYKEKRIGTVLTMYFNSIGLNMSNTKAENNGEKVNCLTPDGMTKINEDKLSKALFLNLKDGAVTSDSLKKYLDEKFPFKSSFEV